MCTSETAEKKYFSFSQMSYKRWLLVAVFLFGIGLGLGLATPPGITSLLTEDMAALEEFADLLTPLPQSSMFAFILTKNVSAVLVSFVLSPILCLVPVMALTLNGWIVGWVSNIVIQEESLGYLLAGLLPHGIFEVPALIMAEAVALSFGTAMILTPFRKEGSQRLLSNLRQNLKYLIVAGGLFLLAAIIETYVTPLLLR